MGPGFETNFLVFLIALGILAGVTWLFRAPLKRLYRYLVLWAEKDRRDELEQRTEMVLRKKAESYCISCDTRAKCEP